MYAKDLSRKVKSAKRQRALNGLFISAQTPYGYIKDSTNKNHLIVDEDVRHVIELIFNMCVNGKGAPTISKVVEEKSGLRDRFVLHNNPFRYKGYYWDSESNLYYCNYRYYSPVLCRWLSPDSIEYLYPQSINGLNLYCYCKNNPIMYSDGSGHIPEWLGNLLTGIGITVGTALFVAAIVASAGTVGELVGVGAAAIGLSSAAVSTTITVATVSTYVVAEGVALFGASNAVEIFSGGINPVRDYLMGGNQKAYNITSGVFNTLGSIAVIAGTVGTKVLQKIAQRGGVPKISKGKTVGYSMDFFDKKGNWNFRIDATTHGNPNAAVWHHDPHYHVVDRGGDGTAVYYLWEIIKRWF